MVRAQVVLAVLPMATATLRQVLEVLGSHMVAAEAVLLMPEAATQVLAEMALFASSGARDALSLPQTLAT